MAANEDLLNCPVCLDTFQDPTLLGDCGHTFCKRCITQVQNTQAGQRQGPRCPTCRKPFRQNQVLPNYALRALLGEQRSASATAAPVQALDGDSATNALQDTPATSEPAGRPGFSRSESIIRTSTSTEPTLAHLIELGVPAELARIVRDESSRVALRIYLIDNSGSMSTPDGQVLEEGRWRRTTRWEEICHMVMNQARWNLELGTSAEFVLLNGPYNNPNSTGLEEGIDYQKVDPALGNGDEQVRQVEKMLMSTQPKGCTPLTDRLQRIRNQILPQARDLAINGQKVIIVVATDGMPTTPYGQIDQQRFCQELRRISVELPSHIVIRLCTDQDDVTEYYNNLDADPELQLEILDDMRAEAREIRQAGNSWFTYSPIFHQIREAGTFIKVLDLVDERRLVPMEVALLAQLLIREHEDDPPLPTDPQAFCEAARALVPKCRLVFDPIRQAMVPPVSVAQLEWAITASGLSRQFGSICEGQCEVQ